MDVYIPLALSILLFSLLFSNRKLFLTLLAFVPLLLFIGTRVGLGVDYDNYERIYNYQHDLDWQTYLIANIDSKFDPGFFLFLKLSPDYNSLIFFSSLIYVLSVAFFFFKLLPGKSYFLAFVLWLFYPLFFESFVAIRTSLALSFFLLACCAKNDDQKILAVILVVVSTLFHMSGVFLMIPILIPQKYIQQYYSEIAVGALSLALLFLLLPFVFPSLLRSLFAMSQNFDNVYSDYLNDTNYGIGFYMLSFFRLGFMFYIYSLLKKGVIKGWLIWFAIVTILYYLLLMVQGVSIMYRFCLYLYFVTLIFKCYVVKIDKSAFAKIYLTLSIVYAIYNFIGITQFPVYEKYFHHYHSFLFN